MIERKKMGRHVAPMGEGRGIYRDFLGKPEGKNERTWKTQE
jgi:hypothetical protein